jgi:hypothetical protein
MINEKIDAAYKAGASMMAGASADTKLFRISASSSCKCEEAEPERGFA